MDRRRFLLASLAGAVAAPLDARAQRGTVARIGVLLQLSPEETPQSAAFRQGLGEQGYVDGESIAIHWRWARGDVKRFPELATDLVRLNVSVIVATVDHAIQAARAATLSSELVIVVN
jgi:putative ABC transport system substrate-binding protein